MERERILTVTVRTTQSEEKIEDRRIELKELIESAGGEVIAEVVQNLDHPIASTYIGKGKVEEVQEACASMEIDAVIFNDSLTGSQMKNLSEVIEPRILDRTDLILDIFALRARSKESKLQVQLAQLEYRLPRLKGIRSDLSRQGAGIGTRGPGEQQLETDRRAIERQISQIKLQLKDIKNKREVTYQRRQNAETKIVSLAGYTNAGKSTIVNQMLKLYGREDKEVYADDRLFATLDTSARRIELPNAPAIVLVDTVGFVTDLPPKLMQSFESTLDEIGMSDLILLVIDSANIGYEGQIEASMHTIKKLDALAPILYVMNKIDLGQKPPVTEASQTISISAKSDDDIAALAERIAVELFGKLVEVKHLFPYSALGTVHAWKERGRVLEMEHGQDGVTATLLVREREVLPW